MVLPVQETLSLRDRQSERRLSAATAASIDANITEPSPLPFKRSVTPDGRPRRARKFDVRSEAKLDALDDAKQHVERLRADLLSAKENGSRDTEGLREQLSVAEEALNVAYSQAIKYTSRQSQDAQAVQTAASLMYEWTGRFINGDVRKNNKFLNRKNMTRRVHEILRALNNDRTPEPKAATETEDEGRTAMLAPSRRDYNNILRAHSTSKALRKGEQCEELIDRMMDVAVYSAQRYAESEDEDEREKLKRIVAESLPDSKVFALAIKCYAGSTRKQFGHNIALFVSRQFLTNPNILALKDSSSAARIELLKSIHDALCQATDGQIGKLHRDDPYVLFHCIKSIKTFNIAAMMTKGYEWLGILHEFVVDPKNAGYFGSGDGDADESTPQSIDVTSAYLHVIRLTARLRDSSPGAASKARDVLDKMHEVYRLSNSGHERSGEASAIPAVATVDIRYNAYNLVLGLYRDSRNAGDSSKALDLIQRMMDSRTSSTDNPIGVPLPTVDSFVYTVLALGNMKDSSKAIQEAERLIDLLEVDESLGASVAVYNAYLTLLNKAYHGQEILLDKAMATLATMNEKSKTNSSVKPDSETVALVMKACSISRHSDRGRILSEVSQLFNKMLEQEPNDKSHEYMTDYIYFNKMKSTELYELDSDVKRERIETLFSEAAGRGLVSAAVLSVLRGAVSAKDFELTVGKGRLPEHWTANCVGPRALYTDGSMGGEGKLTSRKGKSSSRIGKQKKAHAERARRAKERKAGKFFRTM